ncbi:MAG: peptide ABC transporter substrate-binding protein [Spirochaetales bacterium]|nr:peptide ABC transporter substrate-binding protein [Spirochaetales bacterium]
MKQNNRLFMTFFLLTAFLLLLFTTSGVAAFPQQELYDEKDDTPLYSGEEKTESEAESSPETENEKEVPTESEDRIRGESKPVRNDEKAIFSYCITPPEISLDPIHTFTSTEAQVYTALFEGLVSYHPFTLEPLPGIAERWEISRDRKTYTFFLREGAVYSNGDTVLAEHLRDSWLTLIDPEEKAEYGSSIDMVKNARAYRTGEIADKNEVGIEAVDDRTLKVTLEYPAAHFLKVICHHSFAPLHPKMLEEIPSEKPSRLISNGPFYIAGKGPDYLSLKKNNLYWEADTIRLDELRIVYNDDPEEVTELFNRGKLHWVDGQVNVDRLDNQTAVVVNPLFATSYFFFYAGETVYADPGLRRALALLFPWNEIRSGEYMYLPADSLVPTFGSYPRVEGIPSRDVEEALRLLEDIGFPEGEGLPNITISIPEGEESLRIAGLMKNAINTHLKLEAEIDQHPFHEYYTSLKEESFTIGTLNWIGDFADPLTFLQMWTGDSSLNLSEYRDTDFDQMLRDTMDEQGEERYEKLAEAEEYLLRGAIVMPIKNSPAFNIIDMQSIGGWFPNPLDIHPFKYLGFSQPSLPDGVVMNDPASFYMPVRFSAR